MDESKIMKTYSEKKALKVSIRITKGLSKWMTQKGYSPTGIFEEACKDLGYKTTK